MPVSRPDFPNRPRALCAALAALLPMAASAGDWQFDPRLLVEQTYTDNVLLAPRGEEGDFITSITPGFSLRGRGPRHETSVDYNLQRLQYLDKDEFAGTNHQLQSSVDAKLLPEWLALRTAASMRQQEIDNRGLVNRDNRGPDQNRRDVLTYSVAPRLEHSWGSYGTTKFEYSNMSVDQSGRAVELGLADLAGSNDEETYSFEASTGSRFGRMPMSIGATSREIRYESGRVNKFKSVNGKVSYVWSRKLRFTGSGGTEDNSFASRNGNTGKPFWSIGATWTPSPRTTLQADWGDRFFGKNYNIHAEHIHRRFRFSAEYTEDIHTINDFQRELLLIPAFDAQGQPIIDPLTDGQLFIPLDGPTVTEDSYVERRLRVSLDYTLRLGSLGLNFGQSHREYQALARDETTRTAGANFVRRLSPRLSFNLGVMWRMNELSTQSEIGRYFTVYPSIRYTLGPHTTLRMEYDYSRNTGATGVFGGFGGNFGSGGFGNGGTLEGRSYTENAISAGLVFNL